MKREILVCFALILMTAMISTANAYLIQDSDFDSGAYTRVTVYCSGNYYDSQLHGTHAYVKGVVGTALPDEGIVVGWRFVTDVEDTGEWFSFNPTVDEPDEWLEIQYEPGTVAYIDCFGEAGYGHVVGSDLYYMPDTDYISAGIPP